jgi:hypothetical protein
MMASWTYWPDRATAWKARPTDGTKFSIVNAARKPWISWLNVSELLRRGRPITDESECPPPHRHY